jgi:hypothetical protein
MGRYARVLFNIALVVIVLGTSLFAQRIKVIIDQGRPRPRNQRPAGMLVFLQSEKF